MQDPSEGSNCTLWVCHILPGQNIAEVSLEIIVSATQQEKGLWEDRFLLYRCEVGSKRPAGHVTDSENPAHRTHGFPVRLSPNLPGERVEGLYLPRARGWPSNIPHPVSWKLAKDCIEQFCPHGLEGAGKPGESKPLLPAPGCPCMAAKPRVLFLVLSPPGVLHPLPL